jgi:AMP deaminase
VPADIDPSPLSYRTLPRSSHQYVMVDGVIRVFSDQASTTELYPLPGTAADFFTDMHRWAQGGGPMWQVVDQ